MKRGFLDGSYNKCLLLAAAAVIPGNAAIAQQEGASSGTAIDEIVVTAQKRAESVQDVGITMSVLSSDALSQRNVTNVTDIVSLVPNVQANSGAGQVAFNVRGIGMNEFSANLDSPIAVHLDEVYLSKNFMTGMLLFDIDRVEALKGPQGTLFGRNATGGTINFFTRRPTRDLTAGATVSYDNYETIRGEAYVSGPLSESLSARLSGMFVDQGQGYYRNLTRGEREGKERKAAGRAQLLWEGDRTSVLFSGHYGRDWSQMQPYEGVGAFTPESLAAGAPAFCPEYLAGTVTGADANCVRLLDGLYPGDDDPYTSTNNLSHKLRNTSYGTTAKIEHELDWATLTSISSYQYFKRDQREDSDGTPGDTIDVYYYNRIKQFTQEVRFTSPGDGRWNYVFGAFYEHDDYTNGDYLALFGGAVPGLYSPFKQKIDAVALFLHNDVELTDTLNLIAGVRYSREKIKIDGGTFAGTGIGGSPERPTVIGVPLATSDAIPESNRRKDDDATFKVGLEWQPELNSDLLDHLLVYGHVSTGFRSGAFNADFAGAQEAFTSLAPETITAYEAGFKTAMMGRSLQFNGSIFHYAFKDGFINVDSASSPLPITINAANIDTVGVELDLLWRPVERLTIGMAGGWLDSKIKSDITIAGESLKGNRTVQSPKWTYNVQGSYEIPVSDSLNIGLSADASYRSGQYFEAVNSPGSYDSSYWIVNGRVSLREADDRWSLSAWVKNLTKSEYITYVNDLPTLGFLLNIYGAPRTIGATFSVKY